MRSPFPRLRPMGEAALLVELGDQIDPQVNAEAHALAHYLGGFPGVVECVPGYASLLVELDPTLVAPDDLASTVQLALGELVTARAAPPRIVEIPARYGGENGPDLEFVARHNRLAPADVIRLHTAGPLRVFMLGFTPGFAYIGPLPVEIAAPRLETPRTRVPAGSVGIAGRQTGVYPQESPGGWRLIGRTEVVLFDPRREPPALLRPGDLVQFTAM